MSGFSRGAQELQNGKARLLTGPPREAERGSLMILLLVIRLKVIVRYRHHTRFSGARATYKIVGGRATEIGKDDVLKVDKGFGLDATDQIILKTGDAMIEMKKDGTINI